jgi:threonine dehydrogenase-like Zn-dependent dehydrogenase
MRIRKAMMYGAGDLRLEEELIGDDLAPGEILVHTEFTGFSTGTDLGNFEGRSTEVPGAPAYPRPVGYSNAGIVARVGGGVKRCRAGDRVFGIKAHRSAYVAAEDDLLIRIPDGAEPEQAALAYLIHLGVASLRQVDYQPGENVAVVGLGVIGLCTVAAARAMGGQVTAIANSEQRALLARRLGACEALIAGTYNPASVFGGAGADVVVLTANRWDAWRESMEVVRYRGRVSVLGFPGRAQGPPPFNPLDARWLYGKQLTICGAGSIARAECPPGDIRFNLRRNLEYVLEMLASGALNVGPVISHRFPYERMREAYDLASGHSKDFSAAIFDWRAANG